MDLPPTDKAVVAVASTFFNNHATTSGGAIYGNNARVELYDATVNDNTAVTDGGETTQGRPTQQPDQYDDRGQVATNGRGGGSTSRQPPAPGIGGVEHHHAADPPELPEEACTLPLSGTIEDGKNIFAYNTAPQGTDVSRNAQFLPGAGHHHQRQRKHAAMGGGYGPWTVTDPRLGTLPSTAGLPSVYPLLPNSPAIQGEMATRTMIREECAAPS